MSVSVQSVLSGRRPADVSTQPFAHVVVENCLPWDLYDKLAATFPSDDQILRMSRAGQRGPARCNQRHNASAHQILGKRTLHPLWEEFVRYHSSTEFFLEIVDVFGPAIRATHPTLETRLGRSLELLTPGIRFGHTDRGSISLDCQVAINTPVLQAGNARRIYAGAPQELFAMILYFRHENDDSTGGDLEIWRWKAGHQPVFFGKQANESDAEYVATIPYQANTLVAFINSEWALHCVSKRQPTPHSRRLVSIVGDVYRHLPQGLFVKRQKPFGRLRQRVKDLLSF